MSKAVIRLQDEVLLEYNYNETNENAISNGLLVVENLHDNSKTILKSNQDKYTAEENSNNLTLLNEDGIYDLTKIDSNISKIIPNLSDTFVMKYNTVRINIASGFNFLGHDGFNLKVFTYSKSGQKIYFANFVYVRKFAELIQYNSKPIKLSEAVFDKYIELQIPSLEYWLELQNVDNEDILSIFGDRLLVESTLYFEYSLIQNGVYNNGFYQFLLTDTITNQFITKNKYTALSGLIKLSDNGDYFEFQLQYNDNQIEEFIYMLNSIPGNNFYLIHTIKVVEQVGDEYTETDEYTTIQNTNYQRLYKFRPVIQNPNLSSISIDYSVQLVNNVDGMGITIESSISTQEISRFNNRLIKLDIPLTKFDVYNHVVKSQRNIQQQVNEVIKTIVVNQYVEKLMLKTNNGNLEISPLRKNLLLAFSDESNTVTEISNSLVYYLVFPNYNNRIEIKETTDSSINKSKGQLLFVIEESVAKQIYSIKNGNLCYIIGKSTNGNNESIFSKMSYSLD